MEDDMPDEECLAELKTRHLGGWGLAQIAAGTGLAVYAVWVGILQPGFRRVPLKLQVPYIPARKAQVDNVMKLLRGQKGGLVDLGSGDGRIVLEASRQGFTPAVGYELNPWLVRLARFHAWRAGLHGKVLYRREDLWKVDLTECKNITVFLAPSVVSNSVNQYLQQGWPTLVLESHCPAGFPILPAQANTDYLDQVCSVNQQEKLQAELPDDALVVAGRFPFPDWKPCRTEGQGVDRAWAYNMQVQRNHRFRNNNNLTVPNGDLENEISKLKEST